MMPRVEPLGRTTVEIQIAAVVLSRLWRAEYSFTLLELLVGDLSFTLRDGTDRFRDCEEALTILFHFVRAEG